MFSFPPPPIRPRALVGRRIFSFHTGEGVRAFWKRSQNESTYTLHKHTLAHKRADVYAARVVCEYAGGW